MMNNCSPFFYKCSFPDLSQYEATAIMEQSTLKSNGNRSYSAFVIQQTNAVPGASTSKRTRTTSTRCKRNFSNFIKYNQSKEVEVVEEVLAVLLRKKHRNALKCNKNKISKLKAFNFTTFQQTNPREGPGVSQKVRSVPIHHKRDLSDLYKYNQCKNKSPEEKYVKLTIGYLKKLSLAQSQDEINKERKDSYDSEMDWCYDSSMDWRYDLETDCWIYDSEMDWIYDLGRQQ